MNDTLLLRYLLNTISPSELKQLEEWVASDKNNADLLFSMERIWQLKDECRFSDHQNIEPAYRKFLINIEKEKLQTGKRKKSRFSILSFMKYAAILMLIVLLSSNLYYLLTNDKNNDALMNTIEVPKGQRTLLTLSDGTKVWLNAESKFTYPSGFSKKRREVSLVGEAFFEVAHNKAKPFMVHSSLLKVNVLGTKFNMKTYPDETALVTLAEGLVEVCTHNEGNKITLKPNQQVSYSLDSGLILKESIDANLDKSWITGEISFVSQPLSKIKKELERRFNVNIVIKDPALINEAFTCRFKENITIEQILKNLKDTRLIDYEIKDRQIDIFKPIN